MITQAYLDALRTVRYADMRDQITPGDVFALHDEFVASWYGLKIWGVQKFTGPIAHLGLLAKWGDRVIGLESVIPFVRMSPFSNVAGKGFIWLHVNREMSEPELEFALRFVSIGEYSQAEGIRVGIDLIASVAAGRGAKVQTDQDLTHAAECAKYVDITRAQSGLDFGHSYVPTETFERITMTYNVTPVCVLMEA